MFWSVCLLRRLFLDCLFLGYLLQMALHWFVYARPHEPRGNNMLVVSYLATPLKLSGATRIGR